MLIYRIIFLSFSIGLQITAAIFAFRLISLTKKRIAWLFITSAILLMACRRIVTLLGIIVPSYGEILRWVAAESIALVISGFMLTGVVLIAHIFRERLRIEKDLNDTKEHLEHLNHILMAVRNVNQLIVRERDVKRLMNEACEILVKDRGYRFVWVGLVQEGSYQVMPVGQAGFEDGYLSKIKITWDDSEYGNGPTGTAIKSKKPFVMRDFEHDPRYAPWREEALKRGYGSSAVLPLITGERVFGALNVYAENPDTFEDEELNLLFELASDLALAVRSIEDEQARKRAEEKVQESARYARNLIEVSLDPLATISPDGKITDVNQATEKITGLTREKLIGTDFSDYFTEPDKAKEVHQKVLAEGFVRDYTLEAKHSDGRVTPVLYNASVYKDAEGRVTGVFAAARDMTEIRKVESQLRQTQKMEGIGTLAGGIAHDFNNLLVSILGFTELALSDLPAGSKAHEYLVQVLKAGKRAKYLVSQILSFSRQSEEDRKPVQLAPIVMEALKLLHAAIPTTIEIRENIAPDTGVVNADPTQVHQVLMNLCTNAEQAMPEGGAMEISLTNVELDEKFCAKHEGLTPGSFVGLTVMDTGSGMDKETLERIFDPFFTTKDPGKGTGMGLSVVHGIVKSHEGDITVHSEPGMGTTFHVYLPVVESIAERRIEAVEPVRGGTEPILFVDDEAAVVAMGRETLERLGYNVTTRTSSIEALELFRVKPGEFDLVITDQTMPNMTGTDLANELLRIRPDIPIILCTGFSHAITAQKAHALGIRKFVMKPIVGAELGRTVRQVLDKKSKEET